MGSVSAMPLDVPRNLCCRQSTRTKAADKPRPWEKCEDFKKTEQCMQWTTDRKPSWNLGPAIYWLLLLGAMCTVIDLFEPPFLLSSLEGGHQ